MLKKSSKRLVSLIFAGLIMISALFPIYWMVVTSMKDSSEIFSIPPTFFPKLFSKEHYTTMFSNNNIIRYFFNSVFITVVSTVIILFIASLAAYSISRFKFKGKRIFFVAILVSQMLPLITLIIPLYSFWSNLKLTNNYISIIVTYVGFYTAVAIWFLTSYFEGIPKSIDEAATIDGCSSLGILFKIILPLSKPGLMATSITVILGVWQELFISLTFLTDESKRTLPSAIMGFLQSPLGTQWGPLCAGGVIAFIPVLIMYIFMQKYLVKGLTAGSEKG